MAPRDVALRIIRSHPFDLAEVGVVGLLVAATFGYVGMVLAAVPGAEFAGLGAVGAAAALSLVLAVHAIFDAGWLVADEEAGTSPWLVVGAGGWRLLELAAAVGFVVLGLVTAELAADLARYGETDGAGAMLMVLVVFLLILAGTEVVLVAMVLTRAGVTVANQRGPGNPVGTDEDRGSGPDGSGPLEAEGGDSGPSGE